MNDKSERSTSSQESNTGCWLFAGLVAVVLTLSYCNKKEEPSQPVMEAADVSMPVLPPEPVIDELSPDEVSTGFDHFATVAGAMVSGGAQIYSTNCFAALTKSFAWSMLDRCGAFDQAAVRIAGSNSGYFGDSELSYFEPETAAGRYLSATINGGLGSDAADLRLLELQRIAGKLNLPKKAISPPIATDVEGGEGMDGDISNEEVSDINELENQTETGFE